MTPWQRLRRMLYLYTGVVSAGLLLVVTSLWIATRYDSLAWKRVDRADGLSTIDRRFGIAAHEKQISIGHGGMLLKFWELGYPSEVFDNGPSFSSVNWYSDYTARWTVLLPTPNTFIVHYKDRHNIYLCAPLWAIALALTLLPSIQLVQLVRWRRRQREIRLNKLCPDCGYDCRATPDRCPECGKVLRASSLVDVSTLEGVVDDQADAAVADE